MKFLFVTLAAMMALTACDKEEPSKAPVTDVVDAVDTVDVSTDATPAVDVAEDVSVSVAVDATTVEQ